jgi:hypothetical protein
VVSRVRDEIGHRHSVSGDDETLAAFHAVKYLGVVVPQLPLGDDCRHGCDVAHM